MAKRPRLNELLCASESFTESDSSESGSSDSSESGSSDSSDYREFLNGDFSRSTSAFSDDVVEGNIVTGVESDEEDLEINDNDDDEEDGVDDSLLSLATPTPAPIWNWNLGVNPEEVRCFDASQAGWNSYLSPYMNEIDYWNKTFPSDLLHLIVEESNKYSNEVLSKSKDKKRTEGKFKQITGDELLRYLSIRILMGIDQKPELSHYWTKDPMLKSVIVPDIMSSERFYAIQRYLHFSDNESQVQGDRIHKVRKLWEKFNATSESLLKPHENLSVDESLIKHKGNLGFRQFIPSKRSRFGIKTFSVVDEKTGFVLKSIIYAGKESDRQRRTQLGYGGEIVLELCNNYLNANRTIYCDNYFTSPNLAEALLQNTTYLCGTLRANRKNSPKAPPLEKGECCVFTSVKNNNQIMIEFWRDKRIVRIISTGQVHEMVEVTNKYGKKSFKPKTVTNYNLKARGIDLADMVIHFYDTGRKTIKWSTKLFFRLLDLSLYNAFVMMKSNRNLPKMPFLEFRLNLIKQILELTGGLKSMKPKLQNPPIINPYGVPIRLTGRHFIKKNGSQSRCKVCSVNRKLTRSIFGCSDCGVALCVTPCFELYHTKLNFRNH